MAREAQPKVYMTDDGDTLAVAAGDGGAIHGQSAADGTPSQHAAITDLSASIGGSPTPTLDELATQCQNNADKIDSILQVLRNIGAIAS